MSRVLKSLALVATLFAPSTALAAGGHGFSLTVEGFYILDFVIFVGLLVYFVKKPAKKFLEARYERITAEMTAATRLKEAAEAKLAEVERMLSGLETEIVKIREQFREDGEREKARILTEARVQSEKIQAAAVKHLEQETAKLKEALGIELASAVLASTEAKVRARVDQAAHKSLAAGYIDRLERLDNLGSFDRAA